MLQLFELQAQQCIELTQQNKNSLTFQAPFAVDKIEVKKYNELNFVARQFQDVGNDIFSVSDLEEATIYDVKISGNGLECIDRVITTSSSSGKITNYFNHEILEDNSGLSPEGINFNAVEKALKDLIKSATQTIDYCAYNTGMAFIANALIDASNRGVKVRVIAESDNSNSALDGSFPFSITYDDKDALMHNKFIIVDAASPSNAHVVTGSMNFTFNQMMVDPNHLIFIQDQALARAYTVEFEEMWGSTTTTPDKSKAKFGAAKEDNTPHFFNIGGIKVESYFSPSDETSSKIMRTINNANAKVNTGLLILTYNELISQLKLSAEKGIEVKSIIDADNTDLSLISNLQSSGVRAIEDKSSTIFHYKLAVVDGNFANGSPALVTGSHNWTFSAETRNDENTLIIHDAELSNLYDRALDYWWNQWDPSSTVFSYDESIPYAFMVNRESLIIRTLSDNRPNKVLLYNLHGQIMYNNDFPGTHELIIDMSMKPSGLYIIKVKDSNTEHIKTIFKP